MGESREVAINPSDHLLRPMTTVIGAWYFPIWQFEAIARFLVDTKMPIDTIVSHRLSLDDAPDAFRMLTERSAEKMVFEL
ncbi:hypothetical protein ACFV19_24270 [Streptomyces griseoluteus]|uniref:hypothetical protein n=1 Tax=Streptomyces griseoluteus TaxID=29306 RepID=UPI0036851217